MYQTCVQFSGFFCGVGIVTDRIESSPQLTFSSPQKETSCIYLFITSELLQKSGIYLSTTSNLWKNNKFTSDVNFVGFDLPTSPDFTLELQGFFNSKFLSGDLVTT